MKPIKFRAWDGEKMHHWDEIRYVIDSETVVLSDAGCCEMQESDKVSLMQYTGLKDKNGKEIYECDIVKAWYHDGSGGTEGYEVKFEDGAFGIKYDKLGGFETMEVIGNKFENPELL